MIPASTLTRQPQDRGSWQHEMATAITDPAELLAALGLHVPTPIGREQVANVELGSNHQQIARPAVSPQPTAGEQLLKPTSPRVPAPDKPAPTDLLTNARAELATTHLLTAARNEPAIPDLLTAARLAARSFAFRVPWSYARRMRHGDPNDPLLRQVLPLGDELVERYGFVTDPLGERDAVRAPGLLHKYKGRALIITTSACAVHCRYCFRREFPYEDQRSDAGRWREALDAIAADTSIEEVLLSGGDPLSLSDNRLESLTSALARIPHIRRLRLHTRQPIVLPSRVDAGLLAWIQQLPWPTVFVLHANHANEIDSDVREACAQLKAAGITLLNQSVLLRGVNDNVKTLAELSRGLFEAGVLPYYLHMLDRVRGAAHFDVDESRARFMVGELASALPGYLVPRLVREVAGARAKVAISPRFPAQ